MYTYSKLNNHLRSESFPYTMRLIIALEFNTSIMTTYRMNEVHTALCYTDMRVPVRFFFFCLKYWNQDLTGFFFPRIEWEMKPN